MSRLLHTRPLETPEARAQREADTAARQRKAEEDQRLAVSRTIAALREEGSKKAEEAERLSGLLAAFPDVRKHVGRWGKVAYYSKSVNNRATSFDQRYNCGCCADSPLEIWPYVETEHGRLYTDPPMFMVGERTDRGAVPKFGWEQRLREVCIPDAIIERITPLFREDTEEEDDGEST